MSEKVNRIYRGTNSKHYRNKQLQKLIDKSNELWHGKYTHELIVYKNIKTPVWFNCIIHGPFKQTPHSHKKGKVICRGCKADKIREECSITFFKNRTKQQLIDNDYSNSVYTKAKEKMAIYCRHCEDVYWQTPNDHDRPRGCPKCGKRISGEKHSSDTNTFLDSCPEHVKNRTDYSLFEYKNQQTKSKFICKLHQEIYLQLPDGHRVGKNGCRICTSSSGELKVRELLTKWNIEFIQEKIFPPTHYRFDFYLPELDIVIEYDDEQHFRPIPLWGGKVSFKQRQRNDRLKDQLATRLGLTMIRIKYDKFKTMEEYLGNRIDDILRLRKKKEQ